MKAVESIFYDTISLALCRDGTSIVLSDDVGQIYFLNTGQGESQKNAKYDQVWWILHLSIWLKSLLLSDPLSFFLLFSSSLVIIVLLFEIPMDMFLIRFVSNTCFFCFLSNFCCVLFNRPHQTVHTFYIFAPAVLSN